METSEFSAIETINTAIQTQNPFRNLGIVTAQNIWTQQLPDLPTLNKYASEQVFAAINQVKTSDNDKITSLVLTAQYGVGKTHILSRIRHKLEQEGGGFFVYGSADTFDLNFIKYQLQQTITESLSYTGSKGVMQWQEVAAAMANEASKAKNPKTQNIAPQQFVNRFDQIYGKNPTLMDTISKYFLQRKTNLDPYMVKAILWTLSENYAPFAIQWLSGNELDSETAKIMGLPTNANKSNQDKESESLNTILKIINLVSCYNPLIICFDQLETPKVNDAGLTTSQVIADLVSTLFNNLETENYGQGVVILTVMFPDLWKNAVESWMGGIAMRISKFTGKQPIELKYIDQNSIIDLVTLFLQEKFYKPLNLIPPNPIYPFTEEKLITLAKNKPTVREILEYCANNFAVSKPSLPENPADRFELALNKEKELLPPDYLDDDDLIAESLWFGFLTLEGKILEGETFSGQQLNQVKIIEIANVDHRDNPNYRYINFKIIGTDNHNDFKIGVAVCQPKKGPGLEASLTRLTNYEKFDLTRGCLVRSKSYIRPNSQSYKLLEKLTNELGGEMVELREDEIIKLMSLYGVYENRENYNLSETEIFDLIEQQKLTTENELLLEILSDPVEPEIDLFAAFSEDNLSESENQEPDLGELFGKYTEEQLPESENQESDLGALFGENSEEETLENEIKPAQKSTKKVTNYKGKSIKSLTFNGNRYEVRYWKELLINLCEEIQSKHHHNFNKVLSLSGNKRAYFSEDLADLKLPVKIEGTNIYVETNFSSDNVMKLVKDILKLFGYSEESLVIETIDKKRD